MDSHLKDPSSRKQLGMESRTQGVPLILLVDTQSEAREPDLSDLRAAAVLVKPFPLAVMIDTIRGVLRARSETVN
jgi:DNA-binding response OmpR family regulator